MELRAAQVLALLAAPAVEAALAEEAAAEAPLLAAAAAAPPPEADEVAALAAAAAAVALALLAAAEEDEDALPMAFFLVDVADAVALPDEERGDTADLMSGAFGLERPWLLDTERLLETRWSEEPH